MSAAAEAHGPGHGHAHGAGHPPPIHYSSRVSPAVLGMFLFIASEIMAPEPVEEELVFPARVLDLPFRLLRYDLGGASIRSRAALAVLRTSCHSVSPLR